MIHGMNITIHYYFPIILMNLVEVAAVILLVLRDIEMDSFLIQIVQIYRPTQLISQATILT
tara:strand:- start:581 stop:763 length:183 start_codon:yes stop_codon:yes gene_type:complete